ncbi:GNAT family acetyltransferase, partial [Rhizoctonia solani AG-3 Rhs1AP]
MSSPISTSTLGSSSECSFSTVSTSTSSVDYLGNEFNPSRVMYRPMNSADVPRVKDMHHNILKSSSTAAMLRQSLFHLHRRTFVAFIPPKPTPNRTATKPLIIGFATAHISVHGLDIPPEITIINVAVDTLYRRRGIGENLIRAVTGSLLMSATAKRPAEGDALVSVQLRAKDSIVSYFEKLGWEKEEVRRGLTRWGYSDAIRLSRWINAHQL